MLSFMSAVVISAVAAWPLSVLSESMHLGCEATSIDGQTSWVCPDGVGYALPIAALVVGVTIVLVVATVRLWAGLGGQTQRNVVGTRLTWCAAVVAIALGLAVTAMGIAGVSAAYGRQLILVGVICCAAAVLVLMCVHRVNQRSAAASCILCAAVAAAFTPLTGVAAPLVATLAGMFLVAAALQWPNRRALTDAPSDR
ncbi:hypothetical protein AAFP35_01415 [Gordonia sp. CPCC 206044]